MPTIEGPVRYLGDPTYPTGDGKPMAETPIHLRNMIDLIDILEDRYADDPDVYVSGNMLMFYEPGNRRKHVSPDVFVVFGVPKRPQRLNYIVWDEARGPDVVIELTSKSTRREDQTKKLALYRDVLRVPEYFQFDPKNEYLRPPLQGFRLVDGEYRPIEPTGGRLPSRLLGLDFERDGESLRLFDPARGHRLPTRLERIEQIDAERQQAEAEVRRAEAEARRAGAEARRAEAEARRAEAQRQAEADARRALEAEVERLRRELSDQARGPSTGP